MRTSHAVDPFTLKSAFWCLNSMILGIADYISDILVAVALSAEKESDWWLTLTLIFVIVPLIIVNMFSIFWFHQDHVKVRKHRKKHKTSATTNTSTTTISENLERPKGGIFRPLNHSFSEKERKVIIASHIVGLGPILRYILKYFVGRVHKLRCR